MPIDLSNTLIVGISGSALFDLRAADRVFRDKGVRAYRDYMVRTEDEPLLPGTGFAVVQALLGLNAYQKDGGPPLVEAMVMSRNSPETSVRILRAVRAHGLPITRFAFTGGEALDDYAAAFGLDLFLSTAPGDVQRVVDARACAAALLYPPPAGYSPPTNQVRFAFDCDAVLFSEHSEALYKERGLRAFHSAEDEAKDTPLPEGPFAKFLVKLARLKASLPEQVEYSPIRLAVVTARNAPAEARVITTFRAWNVYVDEAFFLGGWAKDRVLAALRPHIFFDDQDLHVGPASSVVPSGRVPYPTGSALGLSMDADERVEVGAVPLTRSPADTPRRGVESENPGAPGLGSVEVGPRPV